MASRTNRKGTKVEKLPSAVLGEEYHAKNALLKVGVHFLEPRIGDFVNSEYYTGNHRLPWNVTAVVDKVGNQYKLYYDDNWYEFNEFSHPVVSKVSSNLIYAVLC